MQEPAPPAKGIRLFVAVDPSEAIRLGMEEAIESLRVVAPRERWVVPEKVHLTLAFLGNVGEEWVGPLQDALSGVGSRHPSFSLVAEGVGTFGSKKNPRVLWVGLGGEVEALASLRSDVEDSLAALVGYEKEERPFRPHLTLARSREPRGSRLLADAADVFPRLELGSFRIDRLILYQSHLSPKGATYTALASSRLT